MKRKTRRVSISFKILVPVSLLIILVCVVLGMNSYINMKNGFVEQGVESADVAAGIALGSIDGDRVSELNEKGKDSPYYDEIIGELRKVKDTCGIAFLYMLYEEQGNLYYSVDTDESEGHKDPGTKYEESYEELSHVFGGEEYVQDYIDSTEDGELITVYKPIKDSAGKIVGVLGCDYDASSVVSRLEHSRNRVFQICGICFAAAVVILILITRRIMKNMRSVDRKLYDLVNNGGDLTQKLEIRSGDEMELIAGSVNELLDYIRQIMKNIYGNSETLNGASREVLDSITGAQDNITDVSSTMEEMSAAMEETDASLTTVSESITDVFQSIENIAASANEGNLMSQEILGNAAEIKNDAVSQQAAVKQKVKEIVENINDKIKKSDSVKKIDELTQEILGITSQTNLLSLNASIEAARVGEAGKGFAVVASEISELAAHSAQATMQIQSVSQEVISAVNDLAMESRKMAEFINEVATGGYGKLLDTSQSYQSDMASINQRMEDFSAECQQLKGNMDSVQQAMQAIKIAVGESAVGIVDTTKLAVSLSDSMSGIGDQAGSNMEISQSLNEEVHKFKLE